MKYKAFISYRHSENGRRHAVALETALKRYAKPTLARPMPIFRDEKHTRPDISLPKLIQEGLENSEYLIFLAERSSAESQWCGKELEYWCNPAKLNRTDRLIIALIDDDIALRGTDGIHWEQTTALPLLLQPYLTSIPLYMDLRWAESPTDTDLLHPRYRHEINSLTARLRGVLPEDLNDEEILVFRRNIQLRNGAIGVLLAMLLLSVGATFWALDERKKAEKNLADRIEQETQKERLNFDKYVRDGDNFVNSSDYDLALVKFQKADSILHSITLKSPEDTSLRSKAAVLSERMEKVTRGSTARPKKELKYR